MKILPRTQFGNPILRKKAEPVPLKFLKTQQFRRFIEDMFFTMYDAEGVGLAAPQVGVPYQLAVIEIRKTKMRPRIKPFPPTIIVNPKILLRSKETSSGWEGCLSFEGVRGLVPRSRKITVSCYNPAGEKKILELSGFPARVFQHEIDHLNGIVYVDRMKDMKTLITVEEFRKRVLKPRRKVG
jgi:peptide deformylase